VWSFGSYRPSLGVRVAALVVADQAPVASPAAFDRGQLERSAETLLELDGRTGEATYHAGGWASYERERDAARSPARIRR
jgi:hypothetical protein